MRILSVKVIHLIMVLLIWTPLNAWCEPAVLSIPELPIIILKPETTDTVSMEVIVSGIVKKPTLDVYVLIHPLKSNLWWVQNKPFVDADGSFECYSYFGTKTEGKNQPYEIIAIATSRKKKYKAGATFETIPPSIHRSRLVRVLRDQ